MPTYLETTNRHQVYIARLATGILKDETYPAINAAYRASRLALMEFGDVNSILDVNRLNAAINKAIAKELTDGFAATTASMSTIAVNESIYTAALLSSATSVLSVPGESKVNKYVREAIMSLTSGKKKQAGVWAQFVKGFVGNGKVDSNGSMSRRYNSVITSAYNESLTSGKMQTVGQLTKQFRALNEGLIRSEAESLVRTGVAHYSGRANELMAADNLDIIEKEVPIITFDDRTSDTCISIDARYSKGWPVGKSPIGYNPWHYQCRSTVGFLLFGQKGFDGTRSSKGASGGKQISASTGFGKWLRDQPASFVKETLGKRKGQLFLEGKLPLANLTDKFLKPLPLSVLDTQS